MALPRRATRRLGGILQRFQSDNAGQSFENSTAHASRLRRMVEEAAGIRKQQKSPRASVKREMRKSVKSKNPEEATAFFEKWQKGELQDDGGTTLVYQPDREAYELYAEALGKSQADESLVESTATSLHEATGHDPACVYVAAIDGAAFRGFFEWARKLKTRMEYNGHNPGPKGHGAIARVSLSQGDTEGALATLEEMRVAGWKGQHEFSDVCSAYSSTIVTSSHRKDADTASKIAEMALEDDAILSMRAASGLVSVGIDSSDTRAVRLGVELVSNGAASKFDEGTLLRALPVVEQADDFDFRSCQAIYELIQERAGGEEECPPEAHLTYAAALARNGSDKAACERLVKAEEAFEDRGEALEDASLAALVKWWGSRSGEGLDLAWEAAKGAAKEHFYSMPTVIVAAVMDACREARDLARAFETFEEAAAMEGFTPDSRIYAILMDTCFRCNKPAAVGRVIEEMERCGVYPNSRCLQVATLAAEMENDVRSFSRYLSELDKMCSEEGTFVPNLQIRRAYRLAESHGDEQLAAMAASLVDRYGHSRNRRQERVNNFRNFRHVTSMNKGNEVTS